jgi:hypothetical protein
MRLNNMRNAIIYHDRNGKSWITIEYVNGKVVTKEYTAQGEDEGV